MKAAAVRAKTATEEYASGHMSVSVCYAECEEFNRLTDGPDNILALVEALESEKRICATWRKTAETNSETLEKAQAAERRWHRVASRIHEQACESDVKIDELEAIRAAAEKLVRCKGRYHSEQNYRALASLFGVNTPDLPPLEHENVHFADAAEMEIAALRQRIAELESRTVTVNLPQRLQPGADGWDDWYMHSDNEGEYLKFDDVLAMLTAAGIKVEAE
ncbi:TPA: ead/Ea22-like family protein [Klebsiella pneumoniae]|nr:ead/Ea22-like family protein [Klebsiella pneumoniae]